MERHKCKECDIQKAINDIEFLVEESINSLLDTENIENLIYNIRVSSSFAHKLHKILELKTDSNGNNSNNNTK
jgi:hypothetical protein